MSKHVCNSCQMVFQSRDELLKHYKSELHNHNLKRKIENLKPLSPEEFEGLADGHDPELESKKEEMREANLKRHKRKNKKNAGRFMRARNLERTSKKIIKKNLSVEDRIKKQERDEEEEERKFDEKIKKKILENDYLVAGDCLFCDNFKNEEKDLEKLLDHMANEHSFFIPDLPYVSDLHGYLTYLAEKVSLGNFCIRCSRLFPSLKAVRQHMYDKPGHHLIDLNEQMDEEDLDQFYDYTSSYPPSEIERLRRLVETGGSDGDQFSEFEKSILKTEEDLEFYLRTVPYREVFKMIDGTKELVTKSGKLGNREFLRYYKQRPVSTTSIVRLRRKENVENLLKSSLGSLWGKKKSMEKYLSLTYDGFDVQSLYDPKKEEIIKKKTSVRTNRENYSNTRLGIRGNMLRRMKGCQLNN